MTDVESKPVANVDTTVPVAGNEVFTRPAVTSIAEAISRMQEVTQLTNPGAPHTAVDGLECFNFLYTTITQRVLDGINSGFFQDREFLTQLDLAFANRYFDALRANITDPDKTPRSWKVLLDRRSNEHIASIQFAVAGVNAHVNFDLAFAVLQTCQTLGTEPNSGTQRADYDKINQIFAEEMQTLREHYENGLERTVDGALSPIVNLVGDWTVEGARDAAWHLAEHISTLHRFGIDEKTFVNQVDRIAALAGALLLTPH